MGSDGNGWGFFSLKLKKLAQRAVKHTTNVDKVFLLNIIEREKFNIVIKQSLAQTYDA